MPSAIRHQFRRHTFASFRTVKRSELRPCQDQRSFPWPDLGMLSSASTADLELSFPVLAMLTLVMPLIHLLLVVSLIIILVVTHLLVVVLEIESLNILRTIS